MITDCFSGPDLLGIEDGPFFLDVGHLLILITPFAIAYTLWRVFVTNRTSPAGFATLGLDENSRAYSKLYCHTIPWRSLFLHALFGAMTFKLGLMSFEIYQYMRGWFE